MRHISSPLRNGDLVTLAEFRYELRKFLHFSEQACASAGLLPHHYLALLAIQGFPERDRVTLGVLAERLQLRHNSAVGLADRLARRGLVRRRRSRHDAREVRLALTPRGLRLLHRVARLHRGELRRLRNVIVRLLERLGH